LQNNASDIHNAQGTLPSCCGNAFFLKPAANERTPAACDLKPLQACTKNPKTVQNGILSW